MNYKKIIKALNMIAEDMENDAKSLDGQPFNGKVVAAQLFKNCAAINAIVKIFIDQVLAVKNAERSNNCGEKTPWLTDK